MGLYRRGKIYWFSIQHEGKRIQGSLETDNKRRAEKRYAKITTDIEEDRYFEKAKAKRITFKEMVDKYMKKYEKSRDATSLKNLLPVFGHLTLSEISTELISEYREGRLMKVKPATVYQELALMRRMFNIARKEWKWITYNPVSDLSFSVGNSNARDRWLMIEEEKKLISCASPAWMQRIIIFALHTGMRRGEILSLKWNNVDLKRRLLLLDRSKNGEKRSIPMTDTVFNMLNNIKVKDISGRVFPYSVAALRDNFERAREKAGIRDFHFHDLRHTCATRLVQNGEELHKVKEWLGHKTIAMTMRYAHHSPESLRSGAAILEECYNSATFANGQV